MSKNLNPYVAVELEVTPTNYEKEAKTQLELYGKWMSFLISDQKVTKVEATHNYLKVFLFVPNDTNLSQVDVIRQRLVSNLDTITTSHKK